MRPIPENLRDLNIADLRELAAEYDIPGRSGMKKGELVSSLEALVSPLESSDPDSPEPDSRDDALEALTRRVAALEAQVNTMGRRIRASSQILGTTNE